MVTSRSKANYSFNPIDPELLKDPYPIYQYLREDDPLHWSDLGIWVLTRYEDCRSVLVDKNFGQGDFVKNIQLFYGPDFDVLSHSSYAWLSRAFVMQDPPDHTRLRGLIASALSLKRIRMMEPRIRILAKRLLEAYRTGDNDNFIFEFAYKFPTLVMCDMLGMNEDEYSSDVLLSLNQAIAESFIVFETRALSAQELFKADEQMTYLMKFFGDLFESRRRNPRDDLTTALVHAQDGEHGALTSEELATSVIGLFGAGFETTAHMIGNGIFCLGEHPDQQKILIDSPDIACDAVEEILRYESSLQATYRTALVDREIDGQRIKQGERVLTIVAAANRDRDVFTNPEDFDIAPRSEKSLTFGGGIHFCIGAALARLEGKVFLEELVVNYPKFTVDVDSARLRNAFLFRGYEYLRVDLC
jgi:cytochrome P450|tara:strand:- start:1167 stop:2414 length:1248 start_codon:yes stop_codon:yes gene_type:complete